MSFELPGIKDKFWTIEKTIQKTNEGTAEDQDEEDHISKSEIQAFILHKADELLDSELTPADVK
jgi:hypothetical protein